MASMLFYISPIEEFYKAGAFDEFANIVAEAEKDEAFKQQISDYRNKLREASVFLEKYREQIKNNKQYQKEQRRIEKMAVKVQNTETMITENGGKFQKGFEGETYQSISGYRNAKSKIAEWKDKNNGASQEISNSSSRTSLINLMNLELAILRTLYDKKFFSKINTNPVMAEFSIVAHFTVEDGERTVERSQISMEDAEQYLKIDNQGNIMLSASVLGSEAVQKTKEVLATFANTQTGELSTRNISKFQNDVAEIVKEAGTFFRDIVNKIAADYKKEAKKNHLGTNKDSLLDAALTTARDKAAVEELIKEHQQNLMAYLAGGGDYSEVKNNWIKRGQLGEAFERLYQLHLAANPDEPTVDYKQLILDSLGNTPWYMSGDIGNIQVKTFFDKTDRHVASLNSLISLCRDLSIILDKILTQDTNVDELAEAARKALEEKRKAFQERSKTDLSKGVKEISDTLASTIFGGKRRGQFIP